MTPIESHQTCQKSVIQIELLSLGVGTLETKPLESVVATITRNHFLILLMRSYDRNYGSEHQDLFILVSVYYFCIYV